MQQPYTVDVGNYAQTSYEGLFGISGANNLFQPNASGGSVTQFTGLPEGSKLFNSDRDNFAPSIGFAWQPDWKDDLLGRLAGSPGQTVIRGGASIA